MSSFSLSPVLYTVDSYGMLTPLLHETFLPLMMLALSVAPSDPAWLLNKLVNMHEGTERTQKITVKRPHKAYKALLLSVVKSFAAARQCMSCITVSSDCTVYSHRWHLPLTLYVWFSPPELTHVTW